VTLFQGLTVGVLEIYGPNVLTTEGQDGRFHRKVTGKLFSERNIRLVYEDSVRQASQMLTSWESKYNNEIIFERYPSFVVLNAVFGQRRSNLRCTSSLPPASVFLSPGTIQGKKYGHSIICHFAMPFGGVYTTCCPSWLYRRRCGDCLRSHYVLPPMDTLNLGGTCTNF
jgi:hypothetical protein